MNYKKRALCEFVVTKIDLIIQYVISFFNKHVILGSKHLDFLDFKNAAYIIKNKEHLNENGIGLKQILQLKKRITTRIRLAPHAPHTNNHSVIIGTEKLDQKR